VKSFPKETSVGKKKRMLKAERFKSKIPEDSRSRISGKGNIWLDTHVGSRGNKKNNTRVGGKEKRKNGTPVKTKKARR